MGLTAQDLWTGKNNSIKEGLEVATRTIAIQILNTTISLELGTASSRTTNDNTIRLRTHYLPPRVVQLVAMTEIHGSEMKDDSVPQHRLLEDDSFLTMEENQHWYKRALMLRDHRQLVYYTDEIPAKVIRVLGNPFCPAWHKDGETLCAVVEASVCVVLEEGDVPELVRMALLSGFRFAVNTGALWNAVPPEYMP